MSGVLTMSPPDFTLYTEPAVSPPEFTITCQTQGGPATTVAWIVDSRFINVLWDNDYETSQVIVDTSRNSVFDNKLRVRGRKNGTYYCAITCVILNYFPEAEGHMHTVDAMLVKVAGEPTNLTAVISGFNSTHINITVSWKSPGGPVIGYVIYYQSERGAVSSDTVSGGESHLLDGLQRGVTYNISIVALSQHLPSLLVGPLTVTSVLVEVEMSCKSLTTSPNKQFTVTCTARAEINGQSVPLEMIIEWTRTNLCLLSLTDSSDSGPALTEKYQEQTAVECRGNTTITSGSPVTSYQSILTATENYTDIIIYQCTARLPIISNTATVTVFVKEMEGISGSGSGHTPDCGSGGSRRSSGLTSDSGSGHTPDHGSGGSGLTSDSGSGHTPDRGSGGSNSSGSTSGYGSGPRGNVLISGSGSGHTSDRGSGGSGLASGSGSGHTPDRGSGDSGRSSGLTSGSGSGHTPDRGSGDSGGSGLTSISGSGGTPDHRSSDSGFIAGSHSSNSRSSDSGSSNIRISVYFRGQTSISVEPSAPSTIRSPPNRTVTSHATCCDPTTSLTTTPGQNMSFGDYGCMYDSIATITRTSEVTAAVVPNTTTTTTTAPSTETTTTITLALAGGVGGIMGLIIVCQSLVIVVLLRQETKRRYRTHTSDDNGGEMLKTSSNTAYRVVKTSQEPEYEVIELQRPTENCN